MSGETCLTALETLLRCEKCAESFDSMNLGNRALIIEIAWWRVA